MASVVLVLLVLAGLPIAVWLDLRNLSDRILRDQADGLGSVIDGIRNYYGTNVVGRVLAGGGATTHVLPNYAEVPGAIPIPATLSLELGSVIERQSASARYRFISDFPFRNRAPHAFDGLEQRALAQLRQDPGRSIYDVSGSIFNRRVRLIMPIVMGAACVACHNTHPDSPKRDWQVGDVRGIEEIAIDQPIEAHVFAFKYLLIYFALAAAAGLAVIAIQHHQAVLIRRFNEELAGSNALLTRISTKLSKYLAPQLYANIFSGQKEVAIATERKKLTIFFSDIVGFTAGTERLQPEELTALLNEYLTEMAASAVKHGGTVDKFIGDAILVFFGDPQTQGVAEDARACLRMAFDMQRRLAVLNGRWRSRGIEEPLRVRMGINTGFCNVGNFGSDDRMDYTIIGAAANLAARLQSVAEPGKIVLSYETYTLVRDLVHVRALPEIMLRGISRPVVPYLVEALLDGDGRPTAIISEHTTGLDLFLDVAAMNAQAEERVRRVLEKAVEALKSRADADRPAPLAGS